MIRRVKTKFKDNWFVADRLTILLMVVALVGTMSFITTYAANGDTMTDTGSEISTTMKNLSEILHDAFNTILSRAKNTATFDGMLIFSQKPGLNLTTIGNYIGVPTNTQSTDQEQSKSVETGDSAQSSNITIDEMLKYHNNSYGSSGITNDYVMAYIVFGQMMNDMGIDETSTADSANNQLRMLFGYGIYFAYVLAYTAGGLIKTIIDAMGRLDLLGYFFNGNAINATALGGGTAASTVIDAISSAPLLQDISQIYTALGSFRYVILGLMIIIYIASITVFKTKAYNATQVAWNRGRNLFYRVVVMFIGIPLVMMVYHEAITIIGRYTDSGRYNISAYVYDEFCDFQAWTADPEQAFKTGGMNLRANYNTISRQISVQNGSGGDLEMAKFIHEANMISNPNIISNPSVSSFIDNSNLTYAEIVERNNSTTINSTSMYAYCRDLLLRYARGARINPNTYADFINDDLTTITETVNGSYPESTNDDDTQKEHDAHEDMVHGWLLTHDGKANTVWSWVQGMPGSYTHHSTIEVYDGYDLELSGAPGSGTALKGGGQDLFVNTLQCAGTGVTLSNAQVNGDELTYQFNMYGGMSPMSMYNYMHSIFSNGSVSVYSASMTPNDAVSSRHYAVTAAYSGINEIIQLLFTLVMLLSLGMVGWIFGISMMMNIMVETIKMIPSIFKMMVGSIQGFVEALATVLAIVTELLVTGLLYTMSINIIDFIVRVVKVAVGLIITILSGSGNMSGAGYDIKSAAGNLVVIVAILWGMFQLIRWRKAIIITIKSMITTVLNAMFGTKAQMPNGASDGVIKAAAGIGAAAMAAHALAGDGALGDVINDLAGEGTTDKLSQAMDQLSEGNLDGAIDTIGSIMDRGPNQTAIDAQEVGDSTSLTDGEATNPGDYVNNAGFTDAQQAEIDEAVNSGDYDKAEELERQYDDENFGSKAAADQYREDAQGDSPQNAPARARRSDEGNSDSTGWKAAAETYNANGLTAEQEDHIDQMVANGASAQAVAQQIDQYAQANFGDGYQDKIAAINEHNGRSGASVQYGDLTSNGHVMTASSDFGARNDNAMIYNMADNGDAGSAVQIEATNGVAQGGGTATAYTNLSAGGNVQAGVNDSGTTAMVSNSAGIHTGGMNAYGTMGLLSRDSVYVNNATNVTYGGNVHEAVANHMQVQQSYTVNDTTTYVGNNDAADTSNNDNDQ